jgi:Xaa-Pro dipeptidase
VFHLPITLRDYGRFTVGVSETVIVSEAGAEPLSVLPRQITLR